MRNRKRQYSSSSSSCEDTIPLKAWKRIKNSFQNDEQYNKLIKNKDLLKYSTEKCELCQAIFHTKYDILLHNSKHWIIPVVRIPVYKCAKCSYNSLSQDVIDNHMPTHITNVPDILKNIVKRQPVVKCEVTINELLGNVKTVNDKNESVKVTASVNNKQVLLGNVKIVNDKKESVKVTTSVNNKPVLLDNFVKNIPSINCDNSVTELVKRKDNGINKRSDILESMTKKELVIKCDDSVTKLIEASSDKNATNIIKDMTAKVSIASSDKNATNIIKDMTANVSIASSDKNATNIIKDMTAKVPIASSDKNATNIIKDMTEKVPIVKCDGTVTKLITNSQWSPLKKEVLQCDSTIKETTKRLSIAEPKKEIDFEHFDLTNDSKDNASEETTTIKNENGTVVKCNENANIDNASQLFNHNDDNIKNRLIFEDDIDDFDGMIKLEVSNEDVDTTNRKTDTNFEKEVDNTNRKTDTNFEKEVDNTNRKTNTNVEKDVSSNKIWFGSKKDTSSSVHYEDLLNPGLYFCKRCPKTFTNRFESLCHEVTHLKIKRPKPFLCHICDRYIAGRQRQMREHILGKHPGYSDQLKRSHAVSHCEKCGLRYYNYKRHAQNYHYMYSCHICQKRFQEEAEKMEHIEKHKLNGEYYDVNLDSDEDDSELYNSNVDYEDMITKSVNVDDYKSKVVVGNYNSIVDDSEKSKVNGYEEKRIRKVCEVCSLFLKDKHSIKYVYVGEYSEVGSQQVCEKCNKKFFEVKLVKMMKRRATANCYNPDFKMKHLENNSNKNRLKHMQKRLKKFNKLSAFYLCCLILAFSLYPVPMK